MKLNKYIQVGVFIAVVLLSSCKKGFEEMNKPWNQASTASPDQLYNGLVSRMILGWQEQATYHSWIYPVTQQAMITAGSGYVIDNAAGELWNTYYYMLGNFRLLEKQINESADKDKLKNLQAMAKTLMAYKTLKTTEIFGDIPYSDAGKAAVEGAAKFRSKYDTQAEIYVHALSELKWAVDNFSTGGDQIDIGQYETFLKGNITKWIKFANSLRLRHAVRMYHKDQATAGPIITEALTKPLLEDGEDIGMWPAQLPGVVLDGRRWSFEAGFFHRMGSTIWSWMSSTNAKDGSGIFDPRVRIFFEPNNAGEWNAYPQNPTVSTPPEGGEPYHSRRRDAWADKGANNIYSPLNYFFAEDLSYIPEIIITAAEVHFTKAEIYTRGLGAAKNMATAKTEYENGIKASLNFWTKIAMESPVWDVNKPSALPGAGVVNGLLTNSKVAFDMVSEDNAAKQIYAQMWIDGFRQPWDVWTLKRRTGDKTPMATDNVAYYNTNFAVIRRFTYPSSEPDYNLENWRTATGGSDLRSKKTWLEP